MKLYLLIIPLCWLTSCATVEQCDPSQKNIFLIAACQDKYEIRHNKLRKKIALEKEILALNKEKNRLLLSEVEQLSRKVADTKIYIAELEVKRRAFHEKYLIAEQTYSDAEVKFLAKEVQALLEQTQKTLEQTYQDLEVAENTVGVKAGSENAAQFLDIKSKIITHINNIKEEISKINKNHVLATLKYSLKVGKLKIKDKRVQVALTLAEYTVDFIEDFIKASEQNSTKE